MDADPGFDGPRLAVAVVSLGGRDWRGRDAERPGDVVAGVAQTLPPAAAGAGQGDGEVVAAAVHRHPGQLDGGCRADVSPSALVGVSALDHVGDDVPSVESLADRQQ